VCFNGHFPGDLFIEAKDDGGGDDNWTTGAISRAKLQSNHQHQQTNIQFFYRPMPFLSLNQQCQSTEGKKITHSMDLLTPSSPGVFQLCLWPLIAPGYLGGGLPCLSSALCCQYPFRYTVYMWSKLRDKLSCVAVRQRLRIEDNATVVLRNRLRWCGHVLRKDGEDKRERELMKAILTRQLGLMGHIMQR